MSYVSLTESDEWRLHDESQDIIGWVAKDASGARLGEVADMVVNTETKYVETIVLDDGSEYPALSASIDQKEGVVYMDEVVEEKAEQEGAAREHLRTVRGEPVVPGADAYAEDFRTHYKATYVSADIPYTTYYEPAYLFGFGMAADEQFQDQSYETVESELRDEFERRFPNRTYGEVREAIRYGYQRGHSR